MKPEGALYFSLLISSIISTFIKNPHPMDEPQTPYLENGILQLNGVIAALTEQSLLLKLKISYLENGQPIPPFISSYLENVEARIQLIYPYHENEMGINKFKSHPSKIVSGDLQQNTDPPKTETGTNKLNSGSPETEIGINNSPAPLPYFIPPVPQNIGKLRHAIGEVFFFRVKYEARYAMMQILIHAYNKSDCSYTALGKLTHRSASGIAKLVASLKKRGLVERSGKSSFKLTPLTLEYIRKADCNLQPPPTNV